MSMLYHVSALCRTGVKVPDASGGKKLPAKPARYVILIGSGRQALRLRLSSVFLKGYFIMSASIRKSDLSKEGSACNPEAIRGRRRRKRLALLLLFLAVSAGTFAFILPNYRFLRNALLSRALPPAAYLALLERDYLKSREAEWQSAADIASERLSEYSIRGISLQAETNRLLSGLTGAVFPLRSAELDFRFGTGADSAGLFQTVLSLNDTACASLELLREPATQRLLAACPQLAAAAIAFPAGSDVFLIRLLSHVCDLAEAFFRSVTEAVRANPYRYLPPFLEALEDVSMERNYPAAVGDGTVTTTRMRAVLSLDRALGIASEQLAAAEQSEPLPASVSACYRFAVWLLKELAGRRSVQLCITAYADQEGRILGHEYELTDDGGLLLSLSGLLRADRAGARSGIITAAWPDASAARKELTFEIDQLGWDPAAGCPTGKITVGIPGSFVPLGLQLILAERDGLPELRIFLRASGITAVTAKLRLTQTLPTDSLLADSRTLVYPLSEWRTFLERLDFNAFLAGIREAAGTEPASLLSLLKQAAELIFQ